MATEITVHTNAVIRAARKTRRSIPDHAGEIRMRLGNDELVLRVFRREDREDLRAIADNANVSRYLQDVFPYPYTLQDADNWLNLTLEETRPCNFALEWKGRLAGGVGLTPMSGCHSGTVELGYWLGEPFWGKGLATKAVAAILPYAFDELFFIRVHAMVFSQNAASARVLEKNGFTREGVMRRHIRKNGVIGDAVIYAKLKIERSKRCGR